MDVENINAVNTEYGATLNAALGGDREALGRLLLGLTDRLYFSALRVLGSRGEAEDAVQYGLLAATRKLMIAGLPYSTLRDAILTHTTLAEALIVVFSSAASAHNVVQAARNRASA